MDFIELPFKLCGVYVILSGETVLYVGRSSDLFVRLGSVKGGHRHEGGKRMREGKLRPTAVRIYPCRTEREARTLETKLTSELSPVYDRASRKLSGRELELIRRFRNGESPTQLATEFCVSRQWVYELSRRNPAV